MEDQRFDRDTVRSFLEKERIATLSELKAALNTNGTMTVFRRLKALGYLTSYSHRGKYYTLSEIAQFDELGLWSYRWVWFSKYGNLLETAKEFIEEAEAGFSALELESIVHVEVRQPLLKLFKEKRIARQKISGVYVYLSADRTKQRRQLLMRQDREGGVGIAVSAEIEVLSHELKAAIILFFSLLDEKQRRLYAGLEAIKLGHGGDLKIARLFGLDVHTVARGRRELFGGDVDLDRRRKKGGGRKRIEKKRRKS